MYAVLILKPEKNPKKQAKKRTNIEFKKTKPYLINFTGKRLDYIFTTTVLFTICSINYNKIDTSFEDVHNDIVIIYFLKEDRKRLI